jgi:hypothetical protein
MNDNKSTIVEAETLTYEPSSRPVMRRKYRRAPLPISGPTVVKVVHFGEGKVIEARIFPIHPEGASPEYMVDYLEHHTTSGCDERHHAHWTFCAEEGLDLYSNLRGRNRWTKWHYAEILEALHSDAERVSEEIDLEDSRFQY